MLRIAINGLRNIRTMTSSFLSKVPEVDIDADGKFKYILMNLSIPSEDNKTGDKILVRGYADCNYHTDIKDKVLERLLKLSESAANGALPECSTKVLGGGTIFHDSENKIIKVYGESQGYGKADHATAVSLLKKMYTDYDVSWTDEAS